MEDLKEEILYFFYSEISGMKVNPNFFKTLGKRIPAVPTAAAKYGAAGAITGETLATIKNYRKVIDAIVYSFRKL